MSYYDHYPSDIDYDEHFGVRRNPRSERLADLNPDVVPAETRTTAQLLEDFATAIQACDDARITAAVQRGTERRQLRVKARGQVA